MEASVICVHSGQKKMWITDRNCFCAVEKDDRLVYDEVEKIRKCFLLKKENITHEYRAGHGDHEFFLLGTDDGSGIFFFLAGIEEGTKDKLLIPEQGE